MVRSLLTSAALAGTALLCGCSGQDVRGAWVGPLPVQGGEDCRIELQSGGAFRFVCAGKDAGAGFGTYQVEGEDILLTYERVSVAGRERMETPRTHRLRMKGRGNEMRLTTDAGIELGWSRKIGE
ncbi:MAG TPA: hypothetical protein VEX38_00690 [Fimbriimonadaceae bacterium]|nr:hypothetical protein [Fimbriimonadaceae bacterium]